MKKTIIAGILIFIPALSFTQGLTAAQLLTGSTNDNNYISGMTTDASGNIYVIGSYNGIMDFDPGPGTTNSPTSIASDIWFGKYSPSGALIWAQAIPGDANDYGQDIAVDNGNPANVFISGNFHKNAFGLIGFTNPGNYYDQSQTMFYAKFNGYGAMLWANAIGAVDGITKGNGIAFDETFSYLYVTGGFTNEIPYNDISVDFDPSASTAILNSNPNGCIFLARYNPGDGSYIYARNFGSSDNSDSWSNDVWAKNGYVYITGIFRNSVDFGSGPLSENTGSTSFVAKFWYNNLATDWALHADYLTVGNKIAVNTDINLPNEPIVYVVGLSYPAGGIGLSSTDNNLAQITINPAGGSGLGQSIALDASGNVFISGIVTGNGEALQFDRRGLSAQGNITLPAGKTDFYLASYTRDLYGNWAYNLNYSQSPGLTGYAANELHSSNGKIILAGNFNGSANFTSCGPSTTYTSTAMDGFIAEYNANDATSLLVNGPIPLCSTGTFTLQNQPLGTTAAWSSNTGGMSINANTGAATRQSSYNGYATATAIVSGSCTTTTLPKQVYVGVPPTPGPITMNASSCPEYYFYTSCVADQGITSYTWQYNQLPSGPITYYPTPTCNSPRITLTPSGATFRVGVQSINACGSSLFSTVNVTSCGGGHRVVIAPNPTSNSLTLQLASVPSSDDETTLIEDVKLKDDKGIVRAQSNNRGAKIVLSVEHILSGTYYLYYRMGSQVTVERILVDK